MFDCLCYILVINVLKLPVYGDISPHYFMLFSPEIHSHTFFFPVFLLWFLTRRGAVGALQHLEGSAAAPSSPERVPWTGSCGFPVLRAALTAGQADRLGWLCWLQEQQSRDGDKEESQRHFSVIFSVKAMSSLLAQRAKTASRSCVGQIMPGGLFTEMEGRSMLHQEMSPALVGDRVL